MEDARTEIQALKRRLAELQHGARNTLAIIRSIVRRTTASSQSLSDYVDHLDGRIAALPVCSIGFPPI